MNFVNQYSYIPSGFNLDPSVARLMTLSSQQPIEWQRSPTVLQGSQIGRADQMVPILEEKTHQPMNDAMAQQNKIRLISADHIASSDAFRAPVCDSPSLGGRGALLNSQESFCAEMLLSLKRSPPRSPMSSPSASDSEQYSSDEADRDEVQQPHTQEELNLLGGIRMEATNNGLSFSLEKESPIRKNTKLIRNKLKQKRCSGACSEHKRRHQRCPMECLNRRRDEMMPKKLNSV